MRWTGACIPARRKLAVGAAVEVRKAVGASVTASDTPHVAGLLAVMAASRPRRGRRPVWKCRSTACATSWSARGAGEGQEQKPPSWFLAGRRSSRQPTAWGNFLVAGDRCSTRRMSGHQKVTAGGSATCSTALCAGTAQPVIIAWGRARSPTKKRPKRPRAVRNATSTGVLLKRNGRLPGQYQAFTLGGSLADEATAGRATYWRMLDKGIPTARPTNRRILRFHRRLAMSAADSPCSAALTTLRADFQAAALFADCFTRPTFPQEEAPRCNNLP